MISGYLVQLFPQFIGRVFFSQSEPQAGVEEYPAGRVDRCQGECYVSRLNVKKAPR